jgi:hypothetical protein
VIAFAGKEKKGAKLRIGLYIEYDPQASIFYHNRLKIQKKKEKEKKKNKSSSLSNALQYPEQHCFLEVSEASLCILLVAAACG